MKQIKFNQETGNVLLQTDENSVGKAYKGYQVLTPLHQNIEYTDYTSWYTINGRIYV